MEVPEVLRSSHPDLEIERKSESIFLLKEESGHIITFTVDAESSYLKVES